MTSRSNENEARNRRLLKALSELLDDDLEDLTEMIRHYRAGKMLGRLFLWLSGAIAGIVALVGFDRVARWWHEHFH